VCGMVCDSVGRENSTTILSSSSPFHHEQ
jgi:hypothetical protein